MTAADHPTVPHPDLDTLADLDAGALDPTAAEDVAAHVGGCARCASVLAAFDTVRADLLALPAPELPAPVAARLDAVFADLRREASGPAPIAAAPPPHQPQGSHPDQRRQQQRPVADLGTPRERKKRRSLKLGTGAVAAAFVLIAAGASVTALVTSSDKSTGGGSAAAGNLPGDAAPQTTDGPPPSVSLDIPSYTKATLQGALGRLSKDSAVTDITRLGETGPGGVMADPARRQACERSIALRSGSLTAVRRIQYNGSPAYVFVFTDDAGRHSAWVVNTDCGTTGGLPAIVLDSVS